jgi:CRP/FNR family transcriptional regulator/CRP/FNR family cyclic AMP-dependent transcriptional regulator
MASTSQDTLILASTWLREYNTRQHSANLKAGTRVTAISEFLRQMPLFVGLSDTELESVARDFVTRQFRQGETIFLQGDAGQLLYLIRSGRVRVFVMGEEGQETSVILYGPGDVFGELAVIDEMPRSASVVAMEDTVVLTLTRDQLREHMRREPLLALNFLKALSARLRYSTQQVETLTFLDVPARLARRLLQLAHEYGVAEEGGVRINSPLTQSDLASLIGATRESINKAMGAFRRRGLVNTAQGYIVIVDPDALREEVRS